MAIPGPKPRRKEMAWSADIAYAVGLMATDGCLSPDGRHLLITSKDLEQLENIKAIFDVRADIGIVYTGKSAGRRPCHRLQWGDVALYDFFLEIGLTPNKSLTLGKIDIPDEYFFDFLRGLYDGDGCFYSYFDPRWRNSYMFYLAFTSASQKHLKWLQEMLNRRLNLKGHCTSGKPVKSQNRFYQLRYAKKESLAILRNMYVNSHVTSLSRKRLKIEHALRIVGESLP